MKKNALTVALTKLLFNKVCTGRTFSLMFENDAYASTCKQNALRDKLISETKYSKRERTLHSVRMYQLTRKGVKYVLDNNEVVDGLTSLRYQLGKGLTVLAQDERSGDKKFRIARSTTAATIANLAGADIPADNYIIGPTNESAANSKCIEDIIRDELVEHEYDDIQLYTVDNPEIVFHSNAAIKSILSKQDSSNDDKDLAGGRYSGIIESPFKSAIMYVAPLFGMSWGDWAMKKDIAALHLWRKFNSATPISYIKRSGLSAILLVTNSEQFTNLYYNTDNAIGNDKAGFGGKYEHLYIVPITREGAKHLHWLMTRDDEEENLRIKERMIQGGFYSNNEHFIKAEPFELRDQAKRRTSICFNFDAKKILSIESAAKNHPNEQFTVLCYEWQEPYYQRVLPSNVKIDLFEFVT